MIREAKQSDVKTIMGMILDNPEFTDDISIVTEDFVGALIEACIVYIGEHGVFVADEISNEMCRVHPLWKGEGSVEVMEVFLTKLPYNVACGFIPSSRSRVMQYFKKCGFGNIFTIPNSIRINGNLEDQVIYKREISCQ